MKKNTKILLAIIILLFSIISLFLISTPNLSSTELLLADVISNENNLVDKYITTEGMLIGNSVEWNPDTIELKFDVNDEHGNILSVRHKGVAPDNFSDGVIVILKGNMNDDGIFVAEKIQTKCPSKYESEDPNNYDKEFHEQFLNSND